jgi:hypothetical protein
MFRKALLFRSAPVLNGYDFYMRICACVVSLNFFVSTTLEHGPHFRARPPRPLVGYSTGAILYQSTRRK